MRRALAVTRLCLAALCAVALVARLTWSLGIGGPVVANFFSYFTMQSAIAGALLWIALALLGLRGREAPAWLDASRVLVVTYQVVAGIGFTGIRLESESAGFPMVVPWSDEVLHYVLPAYAVLDWLLDPGPARRTWRALRVLLAFPALWCLYTLLRGPLVGWYPYFFLDPVQVDPPVIALSCAAAGMLFVAVCAGLTAAGRGLDTLRVRRRSR